MGNKQGESASLEKLNLENEKEKAVKAEVKRMPERALLGHDLARDPSHSRVDSKN